MTKTLALLALHTISIYYLWFLWKDKNKAIQRGTVLTKMGLISKRKSPRLFYFSVWIDFIVLSSLYLLLIFYSIFFFF
jgi:hypothetical protein